MVKVNKLVPEIYSKESRDFQLFSRSLDIIFNYSKYNSSLINYSSDTLINLLSIKLGYKLNVTISNKLHSFIKCLNIIQKYKGSIYGVKMAISSFLNASGINEQPDVDPRVSSEGLNVLVISIPDDLTSEDIVILEKVLDYILPVSTLYYIRTARSISNTEDGKIIYKEAVKVANISNNNSVISTPANQEYIQESGEGGYNEAEVYSDGEYDIKSGDIRFSRVYKSSRNS